MNSQSLTLGDLLAEEQFNLRIIVAPADWESRAVAGVHGTEVDHPVPWLGTNWVMLTMGLRLQRRVDAQRRLVRELQEGGITALGFGTGMAFEQVPKAVIEQARECDFPVFEAPLDTPFNEVSAFAARSLVSSDFLLLRRLVSVQNHLMDSLQAESPEEEVIRRLGSSLDGVIALFLADGQLESLYRRGQLQAQPDDEIWAADIWREMQSREPTFQRFTLGESMVISTPVRANDEIRYWLVAATPPQMNTGTLARSVLEAAGRVLAVVVTARRMTVSRERAERAQLIEQLLDLDAVFNGDLPQAVAALGLDLSAPARGVVVQQRRIRAPDAPGLGAEEVQRLEKLWTGMGAPFLAAQQEDGLYAIVQAPVEQLSAELGKLCAESGALAGIGRPAGSPDQLRVTLSDAGLAVREVAQRGGESPVLSFEDFTLASWLLSQSFHEQVAEKAAGTIGTLVDKPVLYETLQCYMGHNMDVGKTARSLHLHPNSLRYRLAKIEELLGDTLNRPSTIANLHLAMMLHGRPRPPA